MTAKKKILTFVLLAAAVLPLSAKKAKKEKVYDSEKFYLEFSEGAALANVTRIQKESGTNNYVWQDSMVGAFFNVQTRNVFYKIPKLNWLNFYARVEVFYPYFHTFNEMQVYAKQTILYAFDGCLGVPIRIEALKAVKFTITPCLHYMYQLSDEYHLNYIGPGLNLDIGVPLSPRWTVIAGGGFSYNNANLGTNRLIQPFDLSWQWQVNFGVRYSKHYQNSWSIIKKKQAQQIAAEAAAESEASAETEPQQPAVSAD